MKDKEVEGRRLAKKKKKEAVIGSESGQSRKIEIMQLARKHNTSGKLHIMTTGKKKYCWLTSGRFETLALELSSLALVQFHRNASATLIHEAQPRNLLIDQGPSCIGKMKQNSFALF